MKQIFGGALVVIVMAWSLFVFAATESCTRVERGAAPVRAAMDFARWASRNWLSQEARFDMIRWSISADAGTKSFLSHQFYGRNVCEKPVETKVAETEQEKKVAE